jgi:putative transcription factor
MACDLCGCESDLVKTKIEGVVLDVCNSCSKHGKVLEQPKVFAVEKKYSYVNQGLPQYEEVIVEGYSKLVKNAREKLELNHKELGQKVAERESVLSKIETGAFVPDLVLAKKLQKTLNIKLIEKVEI